MENEHHEAAEVTPGEDLMQAHGVLERILRIYEEGAHRIDYDEQFERTVLASAAGIVRRFIEGSHGKLEEQLAFPRLQTANREAEFVTILLLSTSKRTPRDPFEDKEHERFGEHGFESTVTEVDPLEVVLDIDDFARFTAP